MIHRRRSRFPSEPEPGAPSGTRSSPFIALSHRNFRLLWGSQLVSMAGSMMQSAAILWHVSLLVPANSRGIALGMVGLVRIVPIIGFSLVSGVVADALDRRKLMLITQTGMALAAALLAWTAFSGVRALWPVYLLAACGSAFGSFDGPARQSLIPNLVPREHLPNAISLNTIMFQTASVAGPALGGLVIGAWNVGWAYALNALSFLFVIAALLLMRDVPKRPAGEEARSACAPPAKAFASCSGRLSSARPCFSTSSPRSSRRRPRCFRSSPRTSCAWARRATGCSPPRLRWGR